MFTEETAIMNHSKISRYSDLYRQELVQNVLPFWLNHSRDMKCGGYFTCINRKGEIFDHDKFMWLQGREVWCYSFMYNNLEKKDEWLDMALHGATFMEKNGRDEHGNWYFSLNREGKPLIQPYNIFSDCFASMGFASLDKANPCERYKQIALDTFENILSRQNNSKGIYNKVFPGTRTLKNFGLPMILCNLSLELEHLLGEQRVNTFIPSVIDDIMNVFYQPELGLMMENVYEDGTLCDSFEGRVINPGHAIEAMWFIMDLGKRFNDDSLIQKAGGIMLDMLDYGWDKKYGGIFYFLDVRGNPPQQLEWDQKLWWVHVEALVGLAKGYSYTKDVRYLQWFEKVHDYTWEHFKDTEFGEWFGYLNRQGEVLLDLKGGKWKGCFHVPRALYQVSETFKSTLK